MQINAKDTTKIKNSELLQIADAVAHEKGVDKAVIMDAIAQAIQIAGRKKYGSEYNIIAESESSTGEVHLYRIQTVVEEVENPLHEISLDMAQQKGDYNIGDEIRELLPPIDFGRVAAQTAKQVIVQRVRDAERERQYEEYKDRVGEIVNGVVKRFDYGDVVIELSNRDEALIPKGDLIQREHIRVGERVRSVIYSVKRNNSGMQIFLSRTNPEFLRQLFAQEVPEIYDGIIEIPSVARDPGSRAKITVLSHDASIDAVGSCVGVRGTRVQSIISELQGEKIDIIPWTDDLASLVVNALAPAEVTKVVFDEDKRLVEVILPEDQQSLAIGRRGQNVRLASELTGLRIELMTEDEESQKRTEEFQRNSELFIEALNIEDVIAHLLVAEGFEKVEQIAYVDIADLASIEGFDEDIAGELQSRAEDWLAQQKGEEPEEQQEVSDDLREFDAIEPEMLGALIDKGINSLDDLADLSRDEFIELLPDSGLGNNQIDEIIMKARAHWFEEDEKE